MGAGFPWGIEGGVIAVFHFIARMGFEDNELDGATCRGIKQLFRAHNIIYVIHSQHNIKSLLVLHVLLF